jgi:hypothetical protein
MKKLAALIFMIFLSLQSYCRDRFINLYSSMFPSVLNGGTYKVYIEKNGQLMLSANGINYPLSENNIFKDAYDYSLVSGDSESNTWKVYVRRDNPIEFYIELSPLALEYFGSHSSPSHAAHASHSSHASHHSHISSAF